jgi:transglutaminase-like putative cysteine protease
MPFAVLAPYLRPSQYIDSAEPQIIARARALTRPTPRETAVALFDWVRDNIRYDVYASIDPPERYRASFVLSRGSGYCVQKAVLLAALGRAAGIPSRLGFADVRNHKIPPHMRELIGTDLFVFHGYTEFFVEGAWVKATPAFDPETARRAGVLSVELDGENDAMLHPVDPEGHPFIEYLRDRGNHVDVPMDELQRALTETYGEATAARFRRRDRSRRKMAWAPPVN